MVVLVRRRSSARWASIKSQISGRWARRSAVGWSAMRIWRWWDSGMTRRLMARDHFSLLGHQLLCKLNWREGCMGVLGSFDQRDDGGNSVAHEGGDGAGRLDVADVDVRRDGRDGAGARALAAGAVGGGCLGGPGSRLPVPVGVGGRRDEAGGEHVKVHSREASCLGIGRMRVGMENIGRQSLAGGLDISLFWGSHEGSDVHQDREP